MRYKLGINSDMNYTVFLLDANSVLLPWLFRHFSTSVIAPCEVCLFRGFYTNA